MDRRMFFFASSGAAAGSLWIRGFADSGEPEKSPFAGSGLATGKLKPLRHKEVPGFLSSAQIAPHHSAHYGGALNAFVGVENKLEESFAKGVALDAAAFERMKQIQSSRGNSVILHELYFDGLALKETSPPDSIKAAIAKRFGSVDRWAADFVASAKGPRAGQCWSFIRSMAGSTTWSATSMPRAHSGWRCRSS
jgi:superoxide dismutase